MSKSEQAESVAEHLDNWTKVHSFFEKFSACDDGDVADELTEAIVRLLSDQWTRLPVLAESLKSSPSYEEFIFLHIDSTADSGALKKLMELSRHNCPSSLIALCKKITSATSKALE